MRPLTLVVLALLVATPLIAQERGITGAWITEFDRMMRNEGGVIATGDRARARLVLQQKGDSVIGTWETLTPGNAQRPPRQLRGTISGDKVTLTSAFEARINRNGEESVRTITMVYDLTVNGDKLEGTMTDRSPGADMPARPFVATRETSSTAAPARGSALDDERRTAIVEAIASTLTRMYVFPEVAKKMTADLRARAVSGELHAHADAESFARVLTERLQAVSRDKHLRVRAGSPDRPAGRASGPRPNGGMFGRAERLAGDVAYVEIRSFGFPPEAVRAETDSIMSAAADAGALIIDLRANGGGSPHTVALVTSYLFGMEPVHLNSLYFRPADRTDHFYTDPHVSGRKFGPDKPVYVLTSARTFSGAEEFAYNLQTRRRATIVGETTGGGAHPGEGVSLPHGLFMFVPTGRAINPVTKTNWEGVGVKPDTAVAADAALEAALRLAREAVAARR
jgi:hypothetical protein